MAETALVAPDVQGAQRLARVLDQVGVPPRAVLWAYESERGTWRLWIVPPKALEDKREFYLRLAQIYASHASELAGLDLGDVQFMAADHPAVRGLSRIVRVDDIGDLRFSDNVLNGYFLPDAIIIRMAV